MFWKKKAFRQITAKKIGKHQIVGAQKNPGMCHKYQEKKCNNKIMWVVLDLLLNLQSIFGHIITGDVTFLPWTQRHSPPPLSHSAMMDK